MNEQESKQDDTQDDNQERLADLSVSTEEEAQVIGGRPWTYHKVVDNPDILP